jgi:hypothetical protein
MHAQEAHQKQEWERAAFVGWQMGAGKEGETFGKYLERMGIKEKPKKATPQDAQKAIAKARKISQAAKRSLNK